MGLFSISPKRDQFNMGASHMESLSNQKLERFHVSSLQGGAMRDELQVLRQREYQSLSGSMTVPTISAP